MNIESLEGVNKCVKAEKNLSLKILICVLIIYELIQVSNIKSEQEKLGALKQNVNELQTSLTQKEQEVTILTKKIESDKEIENEKKLLETEIQKLEKTATDLNKYMATTEQNLSALSEDIISNTTKDVITYIKDRNLKKLSEYVHPVKGLRVSYNSEIKINSETLIQKSQLSGLLEDTTKYKWGITDGQGQLVNLTFKDYYDSYIYDVDYDSKAEVIYNKYTQRPNQSNNNIYEIYNSGIVVEYFYKGTKANNYTDWKSLYLCYENYESKWYLSGIIHS